MGKFIFRLERLLTIAKNQEEEAKRHLSLCLLELKRGQELLLALSHEQTKALRDLVEGQKGKISIHKLINNHQYCQHLKAEVEEKQLEVIRLENKVEMARSNVEEAMKKYKILEKLKEKQFAAYQHEEIKREQHEVDEIANTLFYTSAGGL